MKGTGKCNSTPFKNFLFGVCCPVNTIKVILSQSVYLNTLFLGKLNPLNSYLVLVYILSLTTVFLESVGENDCRKHFMISLHERMLPDPAGSEPVTSYSPVDAHQTESLKNLMIFCI